MNGGHYLTKGHVILCLLYIKDVPDVKNYFGTGRGPFRVCKRTPAEGVFAPAAIDEFLRIETFGNRDPSARWIFFDPAPPKLRKTEKFGTAPLFSVTGAKAAGQGAPKNLQGLWGHDAASCPHNVKLRKGLASWALPPPFRQGVFFLTHPLPACRAHFTPGPSRPPEPASPFRSRRKETKPRLNIHDPIVYICFILRVRRPFRRRTGSKRSSKPVVGMAIAVIVTFSARLCLRRGGKIGA
jgi:hypothetical protein